MSNSSRREALRAQQAAQAKADRTRKMVGIGAGVAAIVLAVVLVIVVVQGMGSAGSASYPKNVNDVKDGVKVFPAAAKAGAPTIDVYLDFQCPNCKSAEEAYGPTMVALAKSGDIKLVQHTLTFMDDNLANTASTRAAVAVTCADTFGDKYSEMTTAVYAIQAVKEVKGAIGYEDKSLREALPAQLGIAGDQLASYQKCYDSQAPKGFLKDVASKSYAAGVTGTPTFKRNGTTLTLTGKETADEFKAKLLNG